MLKSNRKFPHAIFPFLIFLVPLACSHSVHPDSAPAVQETNLTLVPIYRFNSSILFDHLLTVDHDEGVSLENSAGKYIDEGVGFYLSSQPTSDFSSVLYRCLNNASGGHFTSTSPDCEGQTNEKILGYLSLNPIAKTVPLFRITKTYSANQADHLTNGIDEVIKAVGSIGYTLEKIQGYSPVGP